MGTLSQQQKTNTEQTKTKIKQTEGTLNSLEISINVMGSRTMYQKKEDDQLEFLWSRLAFFPFVT